MFTGIIEDLGVVEGLVKSDSGARLAIESEAGASDIKAGDSISINGACLTVTELGRYVLIFDLSKETVAKTSLGSLKPGDRVNLERALKADSRLNGHFVTGHIDGLGKIISKRPAGEFVEIDIQIPEGLMRYSVEKGSVAVDGISLTINNIKPQSFSMLLIPHTISKTTLAHKDTGDLVNIEMDILAKYIQKINNNPKKSPADNISKGLLREHGFI